MTTMGKTTTTPIVATSRSVRPLPEALSRADDSPTGAWVVTDCGMVRGEPITSVPNKRMVAPYHDHPTARVVRAHEMVHAKVSPQDITPWVDRGIASEESLRACEEFRVNYLVKKAGFDTKHLLDGSEKLASERFIATDDWAGLVHLAFSTANTGGYREMMKSVKKVKPIWAKVIDDFIKRANREARKERSIASTHTNEYGMAEGFSFTERIAEWADRLGAVKPPEPKPTGSGDEGTSKSESDGGGEGKVGETAPSEPLPRKRGRPRKGDEATPTNTALDTHSKVRVSESRTVPSWFPLSVERLPTPVVVTGAMGKKRVASNSGRHPRRLHRLMTDPHKRVFDRVVRGKGGVILIDCSGSMSLDGDDVRSLTEVSYGATVLAYTARSWKVDDDGVPTKPNAWILSDRGRMADLSKSLPFDGFANGVDLPALRWAVTNRQHPSAPIVWVCDGYVTGIYDRPHPLLAKSCYEFAKRNRIILVPTVESAISTLRKLGRGERVTPNYDSLVAHADGLVME